MFHQIHEESSMSTAPDLVMTSQAAESSYVINEDLSVTIDMHASSTDNAGYDVNKTLMTSLNSINYRKRQR